MVITSLDRQITVATENDIVVDDDLGLGRQRCRPIAAEAVGAATGGDGVTNALLGARENQAAQLTLTSSTRTA